MNCKSLKLSIITISYFSEKTIKRCMKSVITQTLLSPSVEYILIDGGSKDRTVEIIKEYALSGGLKYVSEKDHGISHAFNKGLKMARGEFVWFVNSDDWLESRAVDLVLKLLSANSDVDIVCGSVFFYNSENDKLVFKKPNLRNINTTMSVFHPATIMRRQLALDLGSFCLSKKVAMDYDLLLRASIHGARFVVVDNILSYFSYGGISTKSKSVQLKGYLECLCSNLKYRHRVFPAIYSCQRRIVRLYFPRVFSSLQKIKSYFR